MTKTYTQLNQELEEILARLESSSTDIDESVKLYEQGEAKIKQLEEKLKTAKNQVKKLK